MTDRIEEELLGLAHQLKNCLLVIQGSVGLIQARPGDVKQVLELAADMNDASRRANELVSEVQRIARRCPDPTHGQSNFPDESPQGQLDSTRGARRSSAPTP